MSAKEIVMNGNKWKVKGHVFLLSSYDDLSYTSIAYVHVTNVKVRNIRQN